MKIFIKKKLETKCEILGHLDKKDLKLMYQCSDVVISAPLKPEGFCRTVSESLAMKKMIIAYNFGGVKNQLESLDDIYKINPYDKAELKKRIELILEAPLQNYKKIKENSRNHIVKNFSKEQMLSKYKLLYESLLS